LEITVPTSGTVFIAGSIAISRLHPIVCDRIGNAVDRNMAVVVGDADGADTAIQRVLADRQAGSVTVYCSGDSPRNNVGNWPVEHIYPDAPSGTRRWFTAKDIAMAEAADYGLMIWDSRSTGTLSNIIELLGANKTSVVFVNKAKEFIKVADIDGLERLISMMSMTAKDKAEQKMHLTDKVRALRHRQGALAL
jgi:hypothetical protein